MKKLLPILLAGCVLLGGCNNSPRGSTQIDKNSSSITGDNSNQNLLRDSENVKFKYNQPQDAAASVGIYGYANAEVSMESFLNLFSGEPSCEKETFPSGYREEYTFGNESGAILNRGGILQGVDYNTSQGFGYFFIEYDTKAPDETAEFEFISRKEITEKLSKTVKELLGMDIQIKIDAVSAERFSNDVEAHIKAAAELDDDVPKADKYGTPADYYLVSFVQSVDGVTVDGANGNAIFTAKGMELLSVHSPIKITERASESNSFIGLEGAEKLLKEKYEMLFLDDPVNVASAELAYIINDGKLKPTWKFVFADSNVEYYDAYTGKEIIFYTGEGA